MINAKSLVAQVNLKSDENDNALKVVSETLSCFVDVFTFFRKLELLSVSQRSVSI